MKYAVTGHTDGIGKGLYEKIGKENCIGFSKSLGYDIRIHEDRKRILNESTNCDVFINNASSDFGQTEMLLDFFYRWKDSEKTIINIGSRVAEVHLPINHTHLVRYQAQKQSLKITTNDLQQIGYNLKIQYIWFGYVGTRKILEKYPDLEDYITVDECCDAILNFK